MQKYTEKKDFLTKKNVHYKMKTKNFLSINFLLQISHFKKLFLDLRKFCIA